VRALSSAAAFFIGGGTLPAFADSCAINDVAAHQATKSVK
jgi:hypothetical protein